MWLSLREKGRYFQGIIIPKPPTCQMGFDRIWSARGEGGRGAVRSNM
jgi:hypothetical protein